MLNTIKFEMKDHTQVHAIAASLPSTVNQQSQPNVRRKSRVTTNYASLLEDPLASLAGTSMDRPDVQTVAILGYN